MVHRLLCQRLLRNEKFVMLADVHLLLLSVQTLSQKSVKFSLLTNLAYFILQVYLLWDTTIREGDKTPRMCVNIRDKKIKVSFPKENTIIPNSPKDAYNNYFFLVVNAYFVSQSSRPVQKFTCFYSAFLTFLIKVHTIVFPYICRLQRYK